MFTWRWPIFSGRGTPSAVTLAMEEARNCRRFIDVIDDRAGESENQISALWTGVSRLLCPRTLLNTIVIRIRDQQVTGSVDRHIPCSRKRSVRSGTAVAGEAYLLHRSSKSDFVRQTAKLSARESLFRGTGPHAGFQLVSNTASRQRSGLNRPVARTPRQEGQKVRNSGASPDVTYPRLLRTLSRLRAWRRISTTLRRLPEPLVTCAGAWLFERLPGCFQTTPSPFSQNIDRTRPFAWLNLAPVTLGQVVDNQIIMRIPLNTCNPLGLILLAPGIVPTGSGTNFVSSGVRNNDDALLIGRPTKVSHR